jgi:hypothetical protein
MTQHLKPGLSLLLLSLLAALLAGCADAAPVETGSALGGITPETVIERFVSDLNDALRDPALATPETNRAWAERLANHFAPSERVDQRTALRTMLSSFAASLSQLETGQRLLLDLSYSDVVIISREQNRAMVALNDGVLSLRWISANGDVIRQRSRSLTELLDIRNGGLPVIRVDGRWFLTEG